MTTHTMRLDTNAIGGSLYLDDHDITSSVRRDGVTITTENGQPRADVTLMAHALEATITDATVTVHATREQEALLRAGGWAKEGDVCVNGDYLWAQSAIIRAVVENVADLDPDRVKLLRGVAGRLERFATPTPKEGQ